jgi:hypothetical protein
MTKTFKPIALSDNLLSVKRSARVGRSALLITIITKNLKGPGHGGLISIFNYNLQLIARLLLSYA